MVKASPKRIPPKRRFPATKRPLTFPPPKMVIISPPIVTITQRRKYSPAGEDIRQALDKIPGWQSLDDGRLVHAVKAECVNNHDPKTILRRAGRKPLAVRKKKKS